MKIMTVVAILTLAFILPAQTPTTPTPPLFPPPSSVWGGPIPTDPSQCPAVAAHQAGLCPVEAPAGVVTVYLLVNGQKPTPMLSGSMPKTGVQTVNNKTPDINGNVTINATTTLN